jgi:hypothetical protein
MHYWQYMRHFRVVHQDDLSAIGHGVASPIVGAADAYLTALLADIDGRKDFKTSEFAEQLSEHVEERRTGKDTAMRPSQAAPPPPPRPQYASTEFMEPQTPATYSAAIFPRGQQSQEVGSKRTRDPTGSPGDSQQRRGRGKR